MASGTLFTPLSATIPLSPTSSSVGSTALTASKPSVRIVNAGPNVAFIRFGTGTQTAVTTDMPLLPGTVEVFHKGGCDSIAAICAASQTATLYVTEGSGD